LITMCSQMPPKAAVGRWSRDIRGMRIWALSPVRWKTRAGHGMNPQPL
jgi:hypothetical protein